jgi:glycosyltransferase involved in cell wall biosynthesis
MPRPDVAADGGPGLRRRRLRSGFWATIPIAAGPADSTVTLELLARRDDGREVTASLGQIAVVAPAPVPEAGAEPGQDGLDLIAVCMATYEPDPGLLAVQIESLRAQTDDGWICLVSDDHSSEERFAELLAVIGGDRRFAVSRSERRLGFYRNFERALAMVPPRTRLIALCDQDDRWHRDKLTTLRCQLGEASLVYSDLRLVDATGNVLRSTLWRGRRNNYDDLTSMLVANTITGAAMLFPRELLHLALPFPDTPGFQFHDTWLAVVALASGRVAYVDRPLYDYVQHPGAVFGDVTHGSRSSSSARAKLGRRRQEPAWRAAYFYGYLAREAQARVLLARCVSLSPAKRRSLERFIACDRSTVALVWLALRPLRALIGRTETLGSELGLARGVAWKRMTAWAGSLGRLTPAAVADARIPPPQAFSQARLRRWRSRL